MNNYFFSFQEHCFLIPLRIKWLNAKHKRVNTFKGRTLAQQVNRLGTTFEHASWLWMNEKMILKWYCGLHCQWRKKVLISFQRMVLVNYKLIADSWKTVNKVESNKENSLNAFQTKMGFSRIAVFLSESEYFSHPYCAHWKS